MLLGNSLCSSVQDEPSTEAQKSNLLAKPRLNRRRRLSKENTVLSDISNDVTFRESKQSKKKLKRGARVVGGENLAVVDLNQCQPDENVFKRKSARYKSLLANLPQKDESRKSLKRPVKTRTSGKTSKFVVRSNDVHGNINCGLITEMQVDYTDKIFNFDAHNEVDGGQEVCDSCDFADHGHTRKNKTARASLTQSNGDSVSIDYIDEGDPVFSCVHCNALFWYGERLKKDEKSWNPKTFSMCCQQGKILLPLLKEPPSILRSLFFDSTTKESKNFKLNIRHYNNMFTFTSMGGKFENVNRRGGGPYSYVLYGMNFHCIGGLMPIEGAPPVYSQMYIFDTEIEVTNRISAVSKHMGSDEIEPAIVDQLKQMLDGCNPYVKQYRNASSIVRNEGVANLKLRLINNRQRDGRVYNLPTASEVAALIVRDIDESFDVRDIIVEQKTGTPQRINKLHPAYLPLQYPLLFPFGEDGYRDDVKLNIKGKRANNSRVRVSMREFFAYRLMSRESEHSPLLHGSRLLQQFIVDAYTMMESQRIRWVRTHQKELRVDLYQGLSDAVLRGETNAATTGKWIVLPSTFTGGAPYMVQNYQDAMAICRWAGYPDIFVTFTCNPVWPKITRFTDLMNLKPSCRPDILARVFKMELRTLMRTIKDEKLFGTVRAEVYTIEFQKKGLPHAHILIFMEPYDKVTTVERIDELISTEIPDEGYPTYQRRDDGRFVTVGKAQLHNGYVVPYNKILLQKFEAHINVEKCNQSTAIKYLFKYISKGHDRVVAGLFDSNQKKSRSDLVDEVQQYYSCRYISSCEGSWRIFGFEINHRFPPVERLSFHVSNKQFVIYSGKTNVHDLIEQPRVCESQFLAWMDMNNQSEDAQKLTYQEFPNHYVYVKQDRKWKEREKGTAIGRISHAHPSSGELYYLRILLTKIKGPRSFAEIRSYKGHTYNTFREAYYARGLLEDDNEFIAAIKEGSTWSTENALRRLIVNMLLACCLQRPDHVWEKCCTYLSEDLLHIPNNRSMKTAKFITTYAKEQAALRIINTLLGENEKSLTNYPSLPQLDDSASINVANHLIVQELSYDRDSLSTQAADLVSNLNKGQLDIYESVMKSVHCNESGFFFVHGYGGTGKTFLWNALACSLRSEGEIVLAVASSGIAATVLPTGRTAHSRFAIPIDVNETSTCSIGQMTPLAELLRVTKLIIWDEAPMMQRFCLEAFDRSLRDIMHCNSTFSGKTIVLGGDFRQILPVVPKGKRPDIISACINSSYLWRSCQIFHLTENMRLKSTSNNTDQDKLRWFSQWLLDVRDGKLRNELDGFSDIEIPDALLVRSKGNPIASLVGETYPDLLSHLESNDYFNDRAILAPTIAVVNDINNHILGILPGKGSLYLSCDSICKATEDSNGFDNLYSTEFLNGLNSSGMPPHKLRLKVGAPIMLIRNIDQSIGLCNGTRLRVTKLGDSVIEGVTLNGSHPNEKVLIHRMDMNPSDSRLPFQMRRRQFPIILSFAMTINKSQGQSLRHVGLHLSKPVFSHGQLYVALSRVRNIDGLKVYFQNKDGSDSKCTSNVVYKEVFRNIYT